MFFSEKWKLKIEAENVKADGFSVEEKKLTN